MSIGFSKPDPPPPRPEHVALWTAVKGQRAQRARMVECESGCGRYNPAVPAMALETVTEEVTTPAETEPHHDHARQHGVHGDHCGLSVPGTPSLPKIPDSKDHADGGNPQAMATLVQGEVQSQKHDGQDDATQEYLSHVARLKGVASDPRNADVGLTRY